MYFVQKGAQFSVMKFSASDPVWSSVIHKENKLHFKRDDRIFLEMFILNLDKEKDEQKHHMGGRLLLIFNSHEH